MLNRKSWHNDKCIVHKVVISFGPDCVLNFTANVRCFSLKVKRKFVMTKCIFGQTHNKNRSAFFT